MSDPHDDSDLREPFDALRAADRAVDPGYRAIRQRPRAAERPEATNRRRAPEAIRAVSRTRLRRALAPGLAAAAALAALWLTIGPGLERPPAVAPGAPFSPGRWSMPTDALLDLSGVPGESLLRDIPALGIPQPQPPLQRRSGADAQSADRAGRFASFEATRRDLT